MILCVLGQVIVGKDPSELLEGVIQSEHSTVDTPPTQFKELLEYDALWKVSLI